MSAKRGSIDWQGVRTRLRESEGALERALLPDPARIKAVYRQRATQVAGRPAQAGPTRATVPVLVFSLGTERYSLALADLAEVLPFSACTPLPGAPPELLGVINLRGEIRSVVSLARILELPQGEDGASGYIVLLRDQGHGVGLKVDRVEQIQLVAPEELASAGENGPTLPARYVKRVTRDGLILLSIEEILLHPFLKEVS